MAGVVQQVDATVTVAGVAREAASVSVSHEIATSMPDQVAGGGGISMGEVTVTLGEPQVVTTSRRSPWSRRDGWPPAPGEPVTVDAVIDGASSRRFTGMVARAASAVSGPVSVRAVDAVDALRKVRLSQDALLATMPPLEANGSARAVGLTAEYVVDRILRAAGLYATPRAQGDVWVSVPGMGSLWPERGTLATSTGVHVRATPWGWGLTGVDATYRVTGNTFWGGLSLCMMVGWMNPGSTASWSAILADATRSTTVRVTVTSDRVVQVWQDSTRVATFTPDPGWTRVEVVHTAATVRVRTDTGWTGQVARALASWVTAARLTGARVQAGPDARVGGLQAGFVGADASGFYAAAPLSATIRTGSILSTLAALPALEARNGLDLLTEISQAMVASMWVDGDGHFWWWHPDRLRDQTPVMTLTSDADLLDLAWEHEAGSARSAVQVAAAVPAITRASDYRVTVWEGPGETIGQGGTATDIATPPADESWVSLDQYGHMLLVVSEDTAYAGVDRFNRGIGSWYGGTAIDATGRSAGDHTWAEVEGDEFPGPAMVVDKIGPQAWSVTRTVTDIPDNTWPQIAERIDAVTMISANYAGAKMPILRAMARVLWTKTTDTAATAGASSLPVLEHSAGPWVQTAAHRQSLAAWLASQLGTDAAVLTDLPVAYNPAIALGQVIDVVEDVVYRVRLRVLVTEIREDLSSGRASMRLGARILAVTTGLDYDDLAARGGTYTDLAAAGGTNEQMGGL